ncbi:hypothetical protein LH128_07122 [Sphingomonas sp. LH128]|nr:hypothetical protein LH128_07122 [Sphingomonas sp. LH128]
MIGAKIANIRAEQAVMLGESLGQEADAITQWNAIDIKEHQHIVIGQGRRAVAGGGQWKADCLEPLDADGEACRSHCDRIVTHIDDNQLVGFAIAPAQALDELL